MKLFWCEKIDFVNFDFIRKCKTEFQDNNKNPAAEQKTGFFIKSILEPYARATAMPTAWELN